MLDMQKRLLQVAVQRWGRAGIATKLRVPLVILDDWTLAITPMPAPKYSALVEHLLDEFDSAIH
jgi:hypothetical protein